MSTQLLVPHKQNEAQAILSFSHSLWHYVLPHVDLGLETLLCLGEALFPLLALICDDCMKKYTFSECVKEGAGRGLSKVMTRVCATGEMDIAFLNKYYKYAAISGKISIAQTMSARFVACNKLAVPIHGDLSGVLEALAMAYKYRHSDMAAWLRQNHLIKAKDVERFYWHFGDLDPKSVALLFKDYHFNAKQIHAFMEFGIESVCVAGNLSLLHWYHSQYGIHQMRARGYFQRSCESGQVEVARWLVATFPDPIRHDYDDMLFFVIKGGPKTLDFFWEEIIDKDVAVLMTTNSQIVASMCYSGTPDALEWVIRNWCGGTFDNATFNFDYLIYAALSRGNPGVAEYIYTRAIKEDPGFVMGPSLDEMETISEYDPFCLDLYAKYSHFTPESTGHSLKSLVERECARSYNKLAKWFAWRFQLTPDVRKQLLTVFCRYCTTGMTSKARGLRKAAEFTREELMGYDRHIFPRVCGTGYEPTVWWLYDNFKFGEMSDMGYLALYHMCYTGDSHCWKYIVGKFRLTAESMSEIVEIPNFGPMNCWQACTLAMNTNYECKPKMWKLLVDTFGGTAETNLRACDKETLAE